MVSEATTLYHVVEWEPFNWTTSTELQGLLPGSGEDPLNGSVERAAAAWQIEEGQGSGVPLNMPYTIFEILVALVAIIGNSMVIWVFRVERRLRRRTNYYIVSLAIADLFVGLLGIPFAILAAVGLPTNLHACLFTISLLVVLCTISIFCLVAVSIDRYWAILHPMAYSRNVRTRTAIVIIAACWAAGIIIGMLPLFGWHAPQNGTSTRCLFVKVMSYDYLVFLYCLTIVTPAILLIAFYAHIYRVIVRQLRQIVTMNPTGTNANATATPSTPTNGHPHSLPRSNSNSTSTNIVTGIVQQIRRSSSFATQKKSITPTNSISPQTQSPFCFRGSPASQGGTSGGGTMLRVLGAAQKREVKATQNLSVIVLFFMICWLPLYTVNCIKAFCSQCEINSAVMLALIALSHVNSAVNPLLYAYHLKDFRAALKRLILRMMGRPVPRAAELNRHISAASRLQSMREKRPGHPRIYIDSPVWLRQQQVQCLNNTMNNHSKSEVMLTGSITSALRSVVRVASTPTDPHAEFMSQIPEVPSHAERESSKNLTEQSSSFGKIVDSFRRGSSNRQSFNYCYTSDDEDEGIKITVHEESNGTVSGVPRIRRQKKKRKEHGSRVSGNGEEQKVEDNIGDSSEEDDSVFMSPARTPEVNNGHQEMVSHPTDLPTFQKATSENAVVGNEERLYQEYKHRILAIRGSLGLKRSNKDRADCDSFTSSCGGTISSEDLTEFRDPSASSVFIIENESVQLSPKRCDSGATERRDSCKKLKKRKGKSPKSTPTSTPLKKQSPLKVVTQLIFATTHHDMATTTHEEISGISGKFSYMDMEESECGCNDAGGELGNRPSNSIRR